MAGHVAAAQGYAIGSAALVSLALFGAYVTRAEITTKDSSILAPEVRCGPLSPSSPPPSYRPAVLPTQKLLERHAFRGTLLAT